MGLQHRCVAIYVDNKSGQEVAFAMYEPVGVVVVAYQSESLPHAKRFVESVGEEYFVNGLVAPGEYAHGDAAYLIVAYAYHAAAACVHRYDIAFFDSVGGVGHCS